MPKRHIGGQVSGNARAMIRPPVLQFSTQVLEKIKIFSTLIAAASPRTMEVDGLGQNDT